MNTHPTKATLAIALLVALVSTGCRAADPPAAAEDEPAPIAASELTERSRFTDPVTARIEFALDQDPPTVLDITDPSAVAMLEVTVQPGAQFPWHTHPGPVIVTVAQGELTYINADDCVERVYPAGTAFVDPGRGHVHTAYNSSDGVTVLVATFLEAPAEGPLTIPVGEGEEPHDCTVEVAS